MQDWQNKNPAEEIEKKIVDFINRVKTGTKGDGQGAAKDRESRSLSRLLWR